MSKNSANILKNYSPQLRELSARISFCLITEIEIDSQNVNLQNGTGLDHQGFFNWIDIETVAIQIYLF